MTLRSPGTSEPAGAAPTPGDTRSGPAEALVGRARDLAVAQDFLDRARQVGAALLLSGEPGVGKSVVLESAARLAEGAGTRVVRATGMEFGAEVSFSGLDHLLTPVHAGFGHLPAVYRGALSVALGLGDGPTPDRLVLSNAVLDLLRSSARERPLLLVVDDGQWLDRASAAVLGFVGRRLGGSRVGLLAALRTGATGALARAGLPEHELEPLDEQAASQLLRTRYPGLAAGVRQRLLGEAEGNPLALVELPAALTDAQRRAEQALPPVLPVNRRLAQVFGSRVLQLPAPTRELLLLAALQDSGELGVLEKAARSTSGLDDLAPAERSGLVSSGTDSRRLRFRHPLVRSTVVEASTAIERRRAHSALAAAMSDQPERRAWHLAGATVGTDEQVAALLEDTARASLRRGDAVGAVAALSRACELSPDPSHRERRRAEAAYISADVTGELTDAAQFLDQPRRDGPDGAAALQSAVAASYLLLNDDGDVDSAHRVLSEAVARHIDGGGGADPSMVEALHTLMLVCFWGGRAELWQPFDAAVGRYGGQLPDMLTLCWATLADPVRTAVPALARLETTVAGLRDEVDPTRIVRTGIAAFYVDRISGCGEALRRVVDDGRRGGAVASAIDATMLLCFER